MDNNNGKKNEIKIELTPEVANLTNSSWTSSRLRQTCRKPRFRAV